MDSISTWLTCEWRDCLISLLEIKNWYFAVWMKHELKMVLCQRSLQWARTTAGASKFSCVDLLLFKLHGLITRTWYQHRSLETARELEERKDAWLAQTLKEKGTAHLQISGVYLFLSDGPNCHHFSPIYHCTQSGTLTFMTRVSCFLS